MTRETSGLEISYDGNDFLCSLDETNKTANIKRCTSYKEEVIIPQYLKYQSQNYSVTSISENAFAYQKIKSISLPSTIVDLQQNCFYKLKHLEKITFETNQYFTSYNDQFVLKKSSLEKVDFDILFYSISAITTAIIPPFIEIINPNVFEVKLTKVEFSPDSKLRIIEKNAFAYTSIESISIPSHVTKINENAFSNCNHLKNVEIPPDSELTYIGNGAFNATSIEQFTIPPHITVLNQYVFSHCYKLKVVDPSLNSELKKICDYAFVCCPIESITFPSSVEIIEQKWGVNLTSLTSIKFADGNKNYKVFDDKLVLKKSAENQEDFDVLAFTIKNIEEITIPSFIRIIAQYAFGWCQQLKKVEFENDSKLEVIENYSFESSSIESLTIPSSVIKLESEWSKMVTKLSQIKVMPNNKYYTSIDDKIILGKSDQNKEIFDVFIFAARDIEKVEIPNFIETISDFAFNFCNQLQHVGISEDSNLKSIKKNAFEFTIIDSISIPSKLIQIDDFAFNSCMKLRNITFLNNDLNIQSIGQYAFSCTAISYFSIPKNVKIIDQFTFHMIKNLSECDLNSNIETIGKFSLALTSLKKIIIPSSVKLIDEYAFFNCKKLSAIVFMPGSNLEKIEFNALAGKTKIDSISNMPHSAKIEPSAFSLSFRPKIIEYDENTVISQELISFIWFSNCKVIIMVPYQTTNI